MPLNKFQNSFKELMLDNPEALEAPPSALADICEVGEIALPERLKVYRNNIIVSLTEVMVATFPIIDKLVGRQFLELMARSFILESPPKQGCLNLYGEGFDQFIERFELAKSLPYLPDVARFEIALNAAYYAKDDEALDAEALAQIDRDTLPEIHLRPRESVNLVQSSFPLTAIQAFCSKENPEGQLRLDQGGESLIAYRPVLETQTVILDNDEFMMLAHLSESTLGAAVEAVLAQFPSFDFERFLQKHLSLGTFQSLAEHKAK